MISGVKIMSIIEKYRPSNGTEGMIFLDKFCDHCMHDDPDNEIYCEIIEKTMMFDVDDKGYPTEWRYGEDGQPICTKFKQK